MRRIVAVIAVSLFVSLADTHTAAAQEAKPASQPGSVTIPIDDYARLRDAQASPAATVVDTIQLTGTFRDAKLGIVFTGRSVGARSAMTVLDGADDVEISGCDGDGLLRRGTKGTFELIPLAPAFRVRCDLRVSGSDRLQFHAPPSALAVRSAVADGELIAGDEDKDGGRSWSLVRQVAGATETLSATATGRYLITLLPDATRFRYTIDVHNPNRATTTLPMRLASGEHLQRIDAAAPYEVANGRYVFSIPPGDSQLALTGELRGTSFAPPVEASLQYLIIESHPLLRPLASGAAKRISVAEAGLPVQYRGAVAFEVGAGQRVSWSVTKLEALHTISYAVNAAHHTLFIPTDGPILGESVLELNNQGAPDAVIPVRPQPTYASLGDQPVLMTKNKAGQLTVPLSTGKQTLFLQHLQPMRRVAGIGFVRGSVPHLAMPATDNVIELGYPEQWLPLVEIVAARVRIWTPEWGAMIVALLFFLWCDRLLATSPLRFRTRMAVAALVAILGASAEALQYVVTALLAVGTLAVVAPVAPQRWTAARATAIASVIIISGIFIGLPSWTRRQEAMSYMNSGSAGLASVGPVDDNAINMLNEYRKAPGAMGLHAAAMKEGESYQGLPARFELPHPDRQTTFGIQLLPVTREQTITIVAVSSALLWLLRLGLTAWLARILWRERASLVRLRATEALAAPATA